MKFKEFIIKKIKETVESLESKFKYRNKESDFTRDRKMPFDKVVYYCLHKKGMTSKMEIEKFNEIVDTNDISSPAVLKQRGKLSSDIFKDMMHDNNKTFYNEYKEKVKLFKDRYILVAIDGSDFEIPNTIATRKNYNSAKNNESVARCHVFNAFDVLNHYVLSTVIGPQTSSEIKMEEDNLKELKSLELPFPIIRVKDRGYVSLKDIYYSNKNHNKFVTRLKKSDFKKQVSEMQSSDEVIEIPYDQNRIRYYKDADREFYDLMEEAKETIDLRVVKIELSTGDTEYLMTNLTKEEVSYEEMNSLYNLRWEIETNYHLLKESLKIETITSGKDELIKQDIYSQMLAFNTLQAFVEDGNEKIEQEKYKHEMQINKNMAVVFLKCYFILLMIEEDERKRGKMLSELSGKIEKYIEPIRPGRKYLRKKDKKNKYPLNKRKSF